MVFLQQRQLWVVAGVALVGMAASLALFGWAVSREAQASLERLGAAAENRAAAFQAQVDAYLDRIEAIRSLMSHTRETSEGEFVAYVNGLGSPQRARSLRIATYMERTGDKFLIRYAWPLENHGPLKGSNVSAPVRTRSVLRRAVETGEVVLSPRVRVPGRDARRYEVIAYAAVYRAGTTPRTPEERARECIGLVGGLLDVGEVFEEAIARLRPSGLHLRIENDMGEKIHFHRSRAAGWVLGEELKNRLAVQAGGQRWMVRSYLARGTPVRWQEWALLGSLFGFTALVSLQVHGLLGQVSRIRGVVAHRTRRLREANRAAKAAAIVKDRFLANISHEIRTPLNGIAGLSQLLLAGRLDAVQRDNAETILKSSQHLAQLVTEILDYSKLTAGEFVLDSRTFSPGEVLREAHRLFEPLARAKGLELSWTAGPELDVSIEGDDRRVFQVLANLISNAIRFTARGSIRMTGALTEAERGRVEVEFVVEDTGVGIRAADQPRLFQAFSQLDDSPARRHGGTGLGLAISAGLVRAMGGKIEVESEYGVGSRFRCRMPFPLAVEPVRKTGLAQLATLRLGKRILVAEDNPVNQKVVLRLIEKLGCFGDLAVDGEEALQKAAREQYDLILMDCHMPGMDGFEAARRIRQLPAPGNRVPIIALTAATSDTDREKCLSAGMDAFLTKPVDLLALSSMIQEMGRSSEGREGEVDTEPGVYTRFN